MQTVTLNNALEMPILGYGVYRIPPEQTEQALRPLGTGSHSGSEPDGGRAQRA